MAKRKRETANEISDEKVAKIRADIAEWKAGLWAKQIASGPACLCGLARPGAPRVECHRHPEGTDDAQEHGHQPGATP